MDEINELFEKYQKAAGRRKAAADAFFKGVETYQQDIQRDGRKITTELLEGFFDNKYDKNSRVIKTAQDTEKLLANFDQAATLVMSSVATLSLQLKLTLDVLVFEVTASPIRELERPLELSGKTPRQIAREGMESLTAARQKLNQAAIHAVTDAYLIENEVEEALRQATLLLEVRRKRLWDFRRENLSVTWEELRRRAAKEGQEAFSEETRERLVEIITEALKDEIEDFSQLKRGARIIRLLYRLFGAKPVSRENNDTDQMMSLLDQLELENELLKKLDHVFERAEVSISAVRAGAEGSFERQAKI